MKRWGILGWVSFVAILASSDFAAAAKRHFANVPPTLEIEVLDPNADPLGNPAVEVVKDEVGRTRVEIPQAVLVHRYYYSGDRSFQAQSLPGGPVIVVANHPKTGERCYIEVQMIPGVLRVTYSGQGIEYDFGAHGVTIAFCTRHPPRVTYRDGVRLTTRATNGGQVIIQGAASWMQRAGITGCVAGVGRGTKSVVAHAADGVHDVGHAASMPLRQIAARTPIGGLFSASPEDTEQRRRDLSVQRAEQAAQRLGQQADIATLR